MLAGGFAGSGMEGVGSYDLVSRAVVRKFERIQFVGVLGVKTFR